MGVLNETDNILKSRPNSKRFSEHICEKVPKQTFNGRKRNIIAFVSMKLLFEIIFREIILMGDLVE